MFVFVQVYANYITPKYAGNLWPADAILYEYCVLIARQADTFLIVERHLKLFML